jgi:ATP-dependent helicase/nuclease subunit A
MKNLTPYQRAALEIDNHIALTANAGSGKTFVFSKRFVKILIEKDIQLNQIIAITFTEKAASELYSRIAKELDEEIRNANDKTLISKLVQFRNSLVSANISTIHSFCLNTLKEFAPHVGLDASLTLLDTNSSNEFKEKEITSYLDNTLNSEYSSKIKNIIRILGSKSQLLKQIKYGMSRSRVINHLWNNIYSHPIESIIEFHNNCIHEYYQKLIVHKIKYYSNLISQINDEVLNNDIDNKHATQISNLLNRTNDVTDPKECAEVFAEISKLAFTAKGTLRNKGYLKDSTELFQKIEKELWEFLLLIKVFLVSEDEYSVNIQLAEFGKDLLSIMDEVQTSYFQFKTRNGFLDFDDLILLAEQLLKDENVKKKLSEKYKYIMIDEYQDTDESQFNIFSPILNELKTGNLFVVGDEKQSIYKFRDADVKVFAKTKSIIGESAGPNNILDLPHSFRLSPRIAFFCNRLFQNLMKDSELLFNEVEYNQLITSSSNVDEGKIEILLSESDENTEPLLVADRILKLVDEEDLEFSDISVLVRKRSSFNLLETTFLEKGIPYSILGGRGFYEQQEIYDIYNYLKFLSDPSNDLALVGVLRSPFYLISDTDIATLALLNGSTLYQKLKSNSNKKFSKISLLLETHINDQNTLELSELLRKILVETKYLAVISSIDNGKQRIANIKKIISQAKTFKNNQFTTLYDFVQKLEELIVVSEDEGQAQFEIFENAVKLMTIHQAKGLEFKAVILFNSHLRTSSDQAKSRSVVFDKDFGVLTKLPIRNDVFQNYEAAPIVKLGNYKLNRESEAEALRVFYVALTRAEKYLIISGENTGSVNSSSFLGFIKKALGLDEFPETIRMNGSIEYMFEEKGLYSKENICLDINIEVIRKVSVTERKKQELLYDKFTFEDIDVEPIVSFPKNEIISATKVNMYLQCPLKYDLSYNLGYIDLHNEFGNTSEFNFDTNEDEESLPANEVGIITHRILEKGIEDSIEINKYLTKHFDQKNSKNSKVKIEEISKRLQNFFISNIYKEINSYDDYVNEFQIYAKLEDFFIYGILDKYYQTEERKVIVDYKTDKIDKKNFEAKFEYYKYQLIFYCLLLNSHFNDQKDIEVKLVFINRPEYSISNLVTVYEINQFKEMVIDIVNKTRSNFYPKNLDHCKQCQYSINNNCVIK